MMADTDDARLQQMVPVLTPAQIEAVRKHGEIVKVDRGQVLFEQGERGAPFFVVLSGRLKISQRQPDGSERIITTLGPGQFSGEIDLLADRRSLLRGEMVEPGEVVRLDVPAFRRQLAIDAELSEVLIRAFILRRVGLLEFGQGDVVVLGSRHSAETLRLRRFLSRNVHPYRYIDIEDSGAQALLEHYGATRDDVPVVLCRGEGLLKNPSNREVADCVGISVAIDTGVLHDVVIVGAGPAGLAAAVYAASEGLDVLVLEEEACGGQAGSSSKIENYLGFPTGISGAELAGRALTQATKFGAKVATPRKARRLDCGHRPYEIEIEDDTTVRGRAVIIASGARYRRLDVPGIERFEGHGVYYGASNVEALLCQGADVAVVGGGNSAGQAAVFLSRRTKHVDMLVRGAALAESMSAYLAHRIEAEPNITLHLSTEVIAVEGRGRLERLRWRNRLTRDTRILEAGHLFVMIGALPNTGWLDGCVALDRKGFVKAGTDLDQDDLSVWRLNRLPHLLETNRPGVFVAGDVRAQSVKRVASAVGEGSICVQFLHRVLGEEA
jgi:thioredoxin reductase (NADPH)